MKHLEWFNQDPKGPGWLVDMNLKPGTLVLVEGHVYRYSIEKGGLDHILTPVDSPRVPVVVGRPNGLAASG
jgi:hypothetical protein